MILAPSRVMRTLLLLRRRIVVATTEEPTEGGIIAEWGLEFWLMKSDLFLRVHGDDTRPHARGDFAKRFAEGAQRGRVTIGDGCARRALFCVRGSVDDGKCEQAGRSKHCGREDDSGGGEFSHVHSVTPFARS